MKQYRITARRRQRFLEALAETGNVTLAARAAAVSRTSIYAHRNADDDFQRAWLEAEQVAADRLEAEAWRRGVDGVAEPVVSAGRLVTDAAGNPMLTHRYSDQLLMALLRAHRPEKYREKTIDLPGMLTLAAVVEDMHRAREQRLVEPPEPRTIDGVAEDISADVPQKS